MVLRNTLVLLVNVPLQVFIGLVVALLLYEQVKGWRVYRAVIYIPQIISAVIIGFLFKIFFGFEGPFNAVLHGGRAWADWPSSGSATAARPSGWSSSPSSGSASAGRPS